MSFATAQMAESSLTSRSHAPHQASVRALRMPALDSSVVKAMHEDLKAEETVYKVAAVGHLADDQCGRIHDEVKDAILKLRGVEEILKDGCGGRVVDDPSSYNYASPRPEIRERDGSVWRLIHRDREATGQRRIIGGHDYEMIEPGTGHFSAYNNLPRRKII